MRVGLVASLVAAIVGVQFVSLPAVARAAPPEHTKSFAELTALAEQQRAAGDHAAAARSFVAAFGTLSQAEQAGLEGEITVSNAVDDFRLAQAQGSDEPTLLQEENDLLERYASNPQRTGLMPTGLNEEQARVVMRIVELGRAQGGLRGGGEPPSSPTPSKAPPSTTSAPTPTPTPTPTSTPAPTPVQAREDEALSLERERSLVAPAGAFRRHALGAHGGLAIIPSWLLSRWAATHTNALCAGSTIGSFAAERGLVAQAGCNFYVGVDYVHRFSRVIDVRASVQYQRAKLPDGLWLDQRRYDGTAASLGAAD